MATKKETRGRPKKYKTKKQAAKGLYESQANYRKNNMKTFSFRFWIDDDSAVIQQIQNKENKTDYIRQLVLEDIKKGNN